MYESYFGLKTRPFVTVPSPEAYYPAAAAERAKQGVVRLVQRGAGPALVIGPVGTGKTLLCCLLAKQLRLRHRVVQLAGGRISTRRGFLQTVLFELGLPYRGLDETELRLALASHVSSTDVCPHGLALLVDEADRLPKAVLEELRVMTNLVVNNAPCVRPVLFGGPHLDEVFADPKLESFNQRLAGRFYLEPFSYRETVEYIRSRIEATGILVEEILTDDAVDAIHKASYGVPRLVNQVCEHALMLGFVGQHQQLDANAIQEAWSDLQQLPSTHPGPALEQSTVIEFGNLNDDTEGAELEGIECHEHPAPSVGGPEAQLDAIQAQLDELGREFPEIHGDLLFSSMFEGDRSLDESSTASSIEDRNDDADDASDPPVQDSHVEAKEHHDDPPPLLLPHVAIESAQENEPCVGADAQDGDSAVQDAASIEPVSAEFMTTDWLSEPVLVNVELQVPDAAACVYVETYYPDLLECAADEPLPTIIEPTSEQQLASAPPEGTVPDDDQHPVTVELNLRVPAEPAADPFSEDFHDEEALIGRFRSPSALLNARGRRVEAAESQELARQILLLTHAHRFATIEPKPLVIAPIPVEELAADEDTRFDWMIHPAGKHDIAAPTEHEDLERQDVQVPETDFVVLKLAATDSSETHWAETTCLDETLAFSTELETPAWPAGNESSAPATLWSDWLSFLQDPLVDQPSNEFAGDDGLTPAADASVDLPAHGELIEFRTTNNAEAVRALLRSEVDPLEWRRDTQPAEPVAPPAPTESEAPQHCDEVTQDRIRTTAKPLKWLFSSLKSR